MLLVAVIALVAAAAPGPAAATSCPATCASCGSVGTGLAELQCGGRIYRVRDDGYAEADCQGLPLDCGSLPPLPTPAPLHRLELTNCSLPPGAAACLLRALHSPPPEMVMTMALVGEVEEGAFDGLQGVQDVVMMSAASQTTIPPLSPLTPLHLRVVEGTNVSLPPAPLPPSLRSLEVSNSGVRTLTPAAFVGLNDLDTLRVWGNELEEVDEAVFSALPSLHTLSLSRNPLKRLRLGKATRLSSLAASRVSVDLLSEGDVSGLRELKELTLESTVPLSLGPRSLSSLPSLSSLSLTHSGVTSLPADLFEGTRALVNVTLKGNSLQEIDERVFRNQSVLERLDLSHNQVSAITREMFRDLAALTDLSLDHNQLTTLPDRVFSSLPRLRLLSVRHNLVAVVSPRAFQASSLRRLHLAHNLLSYSPPPPPDYGALAQGEYFDIGAQSPFSTLLELEELELSYNNISYIFADWRYVLIQRLKLLDLSHNAFTEIHSSDLQFVQQDLVVDLTYNNITTVLPPPPYLDPPSPRAATLLLEHNPYSCDCNLYPLVRSLPTLPNYRLTDARCAFPPRLTATPLPDLPLDALTCPLPDSLPCLIRPHRDRIECTTSNITMLPDPREYGLPELSLTLTTDIDLSVLPDYVTELNMSNSGLKKIENVPKTVKLLDLSYNKFEKLPLEVLKGNHTLFLKGNPILCDCWNSDSVLNLQKYKYKITDFISVKCESGGGVGVVDGSALCDVHRAAAIGSILAVLGLMLAVIMSVCWRYSLQIRLYLSALPGMEWLVEIGGDDDDEDKQYDVFVSFAQGDFPWVRDRLLPALEGGEYRVCVHYREWQVGEAIPVQIRRSVDASRRTVVVLSRNFVRSQWAVEEFRAACVASARDRRPRALVVLLDAVDLALLQPDLRDYLQLTTYLEASDAHFWPKLRRALPKPRGGVAAPSPGLTPPTDNKLPSLLQAIKNKFKRPSVMDLPDPVKVAPDPIKATSDPKALDVILDQNGQLVNRGYVKDV